MKRGILLFVFLVSVLIINSCVQDEGAIQKSIYDYDCEVSSVYISGLDNGATCQDNGIHGLCDLGDGIYYEVTYNGPECDSLDGLFVRISNDVFEGPYTPEGREEFYNYLCGLYGSSGWGGVGTSAIFLDDEITGTEGTVSGVFVPEFKWYDDEIDWRCSNMDMGYNGGRVSVGAFKWREGHEGQMSDIEIETIYDMSGPELDYGFKFAVNPNSCPGDVHQAIIKPEDGGACYWENPDWPEEILEDPTQDPCYIFYEEQQEGICCSTDRYCNYEGQCYPDTRNYDVSDNSDFAIDLAQHLDWDFKNYGFCMAPFMIGGYEDGGKWMDCDAALSDGVGNLYGHEDVPAYQCDKEFTIVNNNGVTHAYGYGQQVSVEENSLFYTGDRNACYKSGVRESAPSGEPEVGEYTVVGDVECCGDDPNEYLVINADHRVCCDRPEDYINEQGFCGNYQEDKIESFEPTECSFINGCGLVTIVTNQDFFFSDARLFLDDQEIESFNIINPRKVTFYDDGSYVDYFEYDIEYDVEFRAEGYGGDIIQDMKYGGVKISEVIPNYGPIEGGTEVTLKGYGFTDAGFSYYRYFGFGHPDNHGGSFFGEFEVVSDTEVIGIHRGLIDKPAGWVGIRIRKDSYEYILEDSFELGGERIDPPEDNDTYVFEHDMTITSIEPNICYSIDGCEGVVIRGTNFTDDVKIRFGGSTVPRQNTDFISENEVIVKSISVDYPRRIDVSAYDPATSYEHSKYFNFVDGYTYLNGEDGLFFSSITPNFCNNISGIGCEGIRMEGQGFVPDLYISFVNVQGDHGVDGINYISENLIYIDAPEVDYRDIFDIRIYNGEESFKDYEAFIYFGDFEQFEGSQYIFTGLESSGDPDLEEGQTDVYGDPSELDAGLRGGLKILVFIVIPIIVVLTVLIVFLISRKEKKK